MSLVKSYQRDRHGALCSRDQFRVQRNPIAVINERIIISVQRPVKKCAAGRPVIRDIP